MEEDPTTVRFDLRLLLQPSKNGWLEARRSAAELVKIIRDIDSHARLHPWREPSGKSPSRPKTITDPATIHHYSDFTIYFDP